MPIIRCSEQKRCSLEEFYTECIPDKNQVFADTGTSMLKVLQCINETFKETIIFGLTSHTTLLLLNNDRSISPWYVLLNGLVDEYYIEYVIPSDKQPWENATVKGSTTSLNELREYLIIAMTESKGWMNSKELRKLYNTIKNKQIQNNNFSLWLEFEKVDPHNWDIENEFCNIEVMLEDGRHYGLNVWTYRFLETAIYQDQQSGESLKGIYLKPPDLFVKELTRDCIEKSIRDLLKQGDLERVLNPSIKGW